MSIFSCIYFIRIDWSINWLISYLLSSFFLSSFPSPFYFYLHAGWNHSDFALPWAISFLSLSLFSLPPALSMSLNPLWSGFWSCISPKHHLWVNFLLPGQRFFPLMFVLPCSDQLPPSLQGGKLHSSGLFIVENFKHIQQ